MTAIDVVSNGVICYDQQVLLCRHREQDYWTLPGGNVAPGEPIEDSLLRTLRESLRLPVHDYSFVVILECMEPESKPPHHEVRFLFDVNLAHPVQDTIQGDTELKWFWWGNIDSVDIRPRPIAEQLRDPLMENRVWAPWIATAKTSG
ncbi:NUDIX domain-containing protein [Amycolatopsis sp. K13G38]|uniref:NUDIX domain-containing protein n=1 Tax=Amycolatopsis acididurans TaxID=2724524 RepID=A0ABX1J9K8_9PSEU|nr:NUDIX domain-containing protein [Amycolatopsis acididurans]NKQ55584.1 NUDIX domain-containing protein [Amycolatopsis acididurans]